MPDFEDFVANYQGVHRSARAALAARGNAGLFFERFGTKYDHRTKGNLDGQPNKPQWIAAVAGVRGIGPDISAYTTQRLAAIARANSGIIDDTICVGAMPFVTGMGLEHPIENGFAWHRTLGVPYLPGSSVKGVTRAWAQDWAARTSGEDAHRAMCLRIFGNEREDDPDFHRGSVIFLDAVPLSPVTVEADVITPHGAGSGAPDDAKAPSPIHFLVVRPGSRFQFAVMPAPAGAVLSDEDREAGTAVDDARVAMDWLRHALANLGAGAKTKSGYGRFRTNP